MQFYDSDAYLVRSVAEYAGNALQAGEAVLAIAIADHLRRIAAQLSSRGIDVDGALAAGQYATLDASRTLAAILSDGAPSRTRFARLVGQPVAALAGRWPRVRAFGEMVALLWTRGDHEAALALEDLWNELAAQHRFTLLCAYPIAVFRDETGAAHLAGTCARHTQVIPAESYSSLTTPEQRLRAITVLQHKARALEVESLERQRLEREFLDLNARLAAIVDSSEDAIISLSLDGMIESWNASAQRLFEYTAAEAIGQPLTIIIPPELFAEEREIQRRLRRGERVEHVETVRVSKSGQRIDVSLTNSPVRDRAGRLVGVSKIVRDISRPKRAEEALRDRERRIRESEDQYRRLTKLLPVGVYTCAAPTGEITYYNDRAAELWGRAPRIGEAAERFCGSARLLQPDGTVLPHERCPMAIALEEGREFRNQEVVIERPDGSRIIALVNIEALRDDQGRIAGAVNVFQDITAVKDAERALRDTDRRKDEFLATLAHELRNPLAPIRNSLSILRMAGHTPVAAARVHDMLERQVAHMVRLVDDLLELSRISRGAIELRQERVELSAIVNSAIETSRPLMEAAAHHLTVRLTPDPIFVHGDPVRLSQVFANLLNNAAKYTPSRGRIELRSECAGDDVVVSIRDTGIGIPAEMLTRLFEMFARVPHPLRGAQDGLGIGLSLVRTLVTMHGGSVQARSDGIGRGSEFVVRLPRADGLDRDAASEPAAQTAPPADRLHRILVVDDNRDAADSLAMLLTMAGADVRVAYDGPTALESIRAYGPSVVFLDLGLPGMNGHEVARSVRVDPDVKDLVLIALTGWGQESDRRRSLAAGFDHHLVKPVDFGAVQALLATLTEPPRR